MADYAVANPRCELQPIVLRVQPDLLNQIRLMLAVQSPSQKFSVSRLTQIKTITVPFRPTEGRFAIVTNVGHGMRWTRRRREDERR
jgi:hypothetical protein